MVNSITLAKATRRIVNTLNVLETLAEPVMRLSLVQDGLQLRDAEAILDVLVKHDIIMRQDKGQLSLTHLGYQVHKDITTYVQKYGERWGWR